MQIPGFGTEWVEPLKEKLAVLEADANEKRLWLISDERNGTIGLANCLRREECGDKIRYKPWALLGLSVGQRNIKKCKQISWISGQHFPCFFCLTCSTNSAEQVTGLNTALGANMAYITRQNRLLFDIDGRSCSFTCLPKLNCCSWDLLYFTS